MKNSKERWIVFKELAKEVKESVSSPWFARKTPFKIQKKDGMITITGYKDSMLPKMSIPSEIGGVPVRTIGARAFLQCQFLEEVTIEYGATLIEPNAFSSCDHLMKIFMANSVEKIDRNAFFECENLFCAELSEGLREIGNRAFFGCIGLRDIRLPDSIESIGDQAFYGCKKLKSIHIPLALKFLPRSAFDGCTALEHIYVERGSYADSVLSDSPHFSRKLRYIPRI